MKRLGLTSAALLLASLMSQPADAELLFDRGLPTQGINRYEDNLPSPERSNIRWGGNSEGNDRYFGDDFIIGTAGERYRIDHIRTWAILGYREDGPEEPETVGDWFSQIRLLGGTPAEILATLAVGDLEVGSNTSTNPSVAISRSTYPTGNPGYVNFGPIKIAIWQIDFLNLDWVVEGGIRHNFSVQGIGRLRSDTDTFHTWYNHASNAEFSGNEQEGADDLMLVFSDVGDFLQVEEGDNYWDKPSDINIQVFGEPLATEAALRQDAPATSPLVGMIQGLYEMELLTERAYRRLIIETEQGVVKTRAHILEALLDEVYEAEREIVIVSLYGESAYYGDFVFNIGAIDAEDLTDAEIDAILRRLTDTLNRYQSNRIDSGFSLFTYWTESEARAHLDQLKDIGLLSDRVYQQLQDAIETGRIQYLTTLYEDALNWTNVIESLESPSVEERLSTLQQANILSEQGQNTLLLDLNEDKIDNEIEFLNYIDAGVLIDVSEGSDDPYSYFPGIYEVVAQTLVNANILEDRFDDFELYFSKRDGATFSYSSSPSSFGTVTTALRVEGGDGVPESFIDVSLDDCGEICDAVISTQFDGRTYEQAGEYWNPQPEETYRLFYSGGYSEAFSTVQVVELFNKILRDQDSPYRIYETYYGTNVESLEVEEEKVGLIALTQEQAEVYFGWLPDDIEQPGLNSDSINEIITLFEQTGLLEHLSAGQIADGKVRVSRQYIDHASQLFASFEGVLYSPFGEYFYSQYPYATYPQYYAGDQYQELTLGLASISQENFRPTSLVTLYDYDVETGVYTEQYSFELNGNRYSQSFSEEYYEDYPEEYAEEYYEDPYAEILLFLFSTAANEISTGRFYRLMDSDVIAGYLFLTDAQYEALQANDLIQLEPAQ